MGLLPAGTLGWTYWAHMTRRRFSFPGEYKGLPERLVRHNLCHVLGEYDTTPEGEIYNAAFICGFLEEDPYTYLMMALMQEHLGVEIFPGDKGSRLQADPRKMVKAFQRGTAVSRNLYASGWDYWQDMPRPIDQVRAELNIQPKSDDR